MIVFRCKSNPELAPVAAATPHTGDVIGFSDIFPLPLLIVGIIGGIYTGVLTPTEAAAAGATFVVIICMITNKLSVKLIKDSFYEACQTSASLFFIIIGAVLFTKFLTLSGIPFVMAELISGFAVNTTVVLIAMAGIFLLLGMFLEPLGVMLITLPIVLPVCNSLGIDLIWFGVLVVKYIEIGLMTPPVGMHAFIVKSIVGDTIELPVIYKGLLWFLVVEVIIMVLLLFFPSISLFLPSMMD